MFVDTAGVGALHLQRGGARKARLSSGDTHAGGPKKEITVLDGDLQKQRHSKKDNSMTESCLMHCIWKKVVSTWWMDPFRSGAALHQLKPSGDISSTH